MLEVYTIYVLKFHDDLHKFNEKLTWESCWIPMTSLTQSRFEMMLSLTSGHSSFS